jgi:hypothetical protein
VALPCVDYGACDVWPGAGGAPPKAYPHSEPLTAPLAPEPSLEQPLV